MALRSESGTPGRRLEQPGRRGESGAQGVHCTGIDLVGCAAGGIPPEGELGGGGGVQAELDRPDKS
ncbi:hypothetical protein [Streptomyces xanthophaeus]